MSQQDRFDRALAALHDAMLDDASWPAASALIDGACGMRGNALVAGKGRSQKDGSIYWARLCYHGQRCPERERWYFDNYYARDERVPRLAVLPDSCLVPMADLYTAGERKSSAAYNEALPRGGYQNGLNVRLDGPDGSSIVWTLTDSIEPDGWSSPQIKLVKGLMPHVRQFVRVRQTLAAAAALRTSLAGMLDNTCIGIVHLDRDGQIVDANDRARTIMRQGDGLQDEERRLRTHVPADNARLDALLARALPRFGDQPVGGSMTLQRVPRRPGLVLHIHPVSDDQMAVGAAGTAVLVLVVDPASQPDIEPDLVASTLGLTPAESRVAVAVATGRSAREIAAATGRRESSVRFHLKQIYRKHGIAGQIGLVRLVLPLARYGGSRRQNAIRPG